MSWTAVWWIPFPTELVPFLLQTSTTTVRLLLLVTSTLLLRNRKMCPGNHLLHFCLCLISSCSMCSEDPLLFFCFFFSPLLQRCYEILTSWTASAPLSLRFILSSQQCLCWPLFCSLGYSSIWMFCFHKPPITCSPKFIIYKTLPILTLGDINLVSWSKRAQPLPYNIVPLLGTIDKYSQHFF